MMARTGRVARSWGRRSVTAAATPLGAAAVAGLVTAALLLFGPPGGDQAAHLYLTQAWRDNGWQLWDNFWYSGRYAQVNYSLIFYPFAAVAGTTFAVAASCAGAAAAFAALLRRRWPQIAAVPAAAFALLVPLGAVAGTYPFLLGLALALATLLALELGHRALALLGIVLTALAHPLALAFLLVVLVAVGAATRGWWRRPGDVAIAAGAAVVAGSQLVLLRGFSSDGAHYPFDPKDALAIAGFCIAGLLLTRGLPDQRPLQAVFVGYAALGAAAFALSSPLGGNAVRLMLLMGVPLLLLPLAARGFRPRGIAVSLLAVALMWQALPAVAGWRTAADSRAQDERFWYPVIAWLEQHPDMDHRVQVVATADNWEAYYLARRGVPLARGWFRQDDFPANQALYEDLTPRRYVTWLHRTGVRWVFLPDDPLDYSARSEAELLESGYSGLDRVARIGGWTVFEVPDAVPIATPADGISVLALTSTNITLDVKEPGTYRLRLRYTPYWQVERGSACAEPREPFGTDLRVERPGIVRLGFDVRLGTFVGAVLGSRGGCATSPAPAPLQR
jgi:MFS family permease